MSFSLQANMKHKNRSRFASEEIEHQRTGVTRGVDGKDRVSSLVLSARPWTPLISKDWIPIVHQKPEVRGTPRVSHLEGAICFKRSSTDLLIPTYKLPTYPSRPGSAPLFSGR